MIDPRSVPVHQAFFGWSQHSGKLDLLAYSFKDELAIWHRIEALIRLRPIPGTMLPPSALSYLDMGDGNVAVLRRVVHGHSTGRNNSHALIGPATVLDVRAAIGLANWDGWLELSPPSAPWLVPYSAADIAPVRDRFDRLRPDAEQIEPQLAMVLARLLDDPRRPLSIIGCPDEFRLAMIWGLYSAADHYLRSQHGCSRRWSFSTHEDRHDDSIEGLPEVVFLPARPGSTGIVNRTIVDLEGEPGDSASTADAQHLVAWLFGNARYPVAKPSSEHVPAHSGVDSNNVVLAQQGSQVQFGQQTGGNQPMERHLVTALVQAKSLREFTHGLGALESSVTWPHERQRLRAELDVSTLNRIARFVDVTARHELYLRLLKITYGRDFDDLSGDGRDHAAKLIHDSESDRLALMVGRVTAARAANGAIRAGVPDRLGGGVGPATPGPAGHVLGRRKPQPKRYLFPAAVAILVLTLVFLLGYLTGLPSATPRSSTLPPPGVAPPPSATPEPTLAEQPSPLASITVHTKPVQGRRIFAFVQVDSGYYAQTPCRSLHNTEIWACDQLRTPPGSAGTKPQLLAYGVPQDEVEQLKQRAAANEPVSLGQDWDGPFVR